MGDRSIRELVREIQVAIRDGKLPPTEIAMKLARLSGLYGNVMQETRSAELAYKHILLGAYATEGKSNRAKILAETSLEYQRYREARDIEKLVLEMMRSLKECLRSLQEEMRMAR
jgi:hypothetical protein